VRGRVLEDGEMVGYQGMWGIGLACRDLARPFVLEPWRPTAQECSGGPFVCMRRGLYTPEVGMGLRSPPPSEAA
jgi:hypothetical protein